MDLRDLIQFAPQKWLEDGGRVLAVAYHGYLIRASDLPAPIALNLHDVRAVFLFDSLTLIAPTSYSVAADDAGGWAFHLDVGQETVLPRAPYTALMTSLLPDGADEPAARERISVAAGLLATMNGRNVVFEPVGEGDFGEETTTFYGPSMENPDSFGTPRLDRDYCGLIEETAARLSSLTPPEQGRVKLSLRWLDMGMHDTGVDALLKLWFAIETLGMADTTNIRPLEELLAHAYGMSPEEVRSSFLLGRLFGRRSDIVHQGKLTPVRGEVLDYLHAVFSDLLRQVLGVPPAHRAGRLLASGHITEELVSG